MAGTVRGVMGWGLQRGGSLGPGKGAEVKGGTGTGEGHREGDWQVEAGGRHWWGGNVLVQVQEVWLCSGQSPEHLLSALSSWDLRGGVGGR